MDNADFSQRYAHSEDDGYLEQAEQVVRSLERQSGFKYLGQFTDPEKRKEFVKGMAEQLKGGNGQGNPAQPQEPKEEAFLSRAADDKFWNNPEEQKNYTTKKL